MNITNYKNILYNVLYIWTSSICTSTIVLLKLQSTSKIPLIKGDSILESPQQARHVELAMGLSEAGIHIKIIFPFTL